MISRSDMLGSLGRSQVSRGHAHVQNTYPTSAISHVPAFIVKGPITCREQYAPSATPPSLA